MHPFMRAWILAEVTDCQAFTVIKMCFSQRKASDPSRFTNRGGNLLKEEKQRAKLQKTLPKVILLLRMFAAWLQNISLFVDPLL